MVWNGFELLNGFEVVQPDRPAIRWEKSRLNSRHVIPPEGVQWYVLRQEVPREKSQLCGSW